jgi:hypothetical protein
MSVYFVSQLTFGFFTAVLIRICRFPTLQFPFILNANATDASS